MHRFITASFAPATALFLSTLIAGPAPGQEPEYDLSQFALALATAEGGGELLAGEVPDGFPLEVLPQGAELLGTVTGRYEHTVVVRVDEENRQAAENTFRQTLQRAGWEYAASSNRGGFKFSAAAENSFPGVPIFCRGGDMMRISSGRSDEGTLAKLHWRPDGRSVWCDATGAVGTRIPALVPPASARVIGGGSESEGDHYASASMMLESNLSAAELVAHYATQLTAWGWEPTESTDSPTQAAQIFELQDPGDTRLVGVLSATRIPEVGYEVRMVVVEPEELQAGAARRGQ